MHSLGAQSRENKVEVVSVERLQHGLARAKAKSKSRTQSGAIKVQGSKTDLKQVKLSRATSKEICNIAKKIWSQVIWDYLWQLLNRPSQRRLANVVRD